MTYNALIKNFGWTKVNIAKVFLIKNLCKHLGKPMDL
jgi:hypothetical protein